VWAGLQALLAPVVVFVTFLLIRGIFGILGSATASSSQAYVADRTSAKERTSALSALAGALGMGTIIGPALSPLLVFGFLGLAGPMTIFALGAGVVLLMVMLIIPRDIPPAKLYPDKFANAHTAAARKERGFGIWLDRDIGPWLIFGFLSCCVQAINVYTLGFVVMDVVALPATEAQRYIGMAMAAGAGAGLFGQWVLIPWLKMSPRALIWSGGLLALAGNLLTVFAHDIWMLSLGYVVLTLGFSFCRPGFTAGASLAARPDQQGIVAGMVSSLSGGSIVITPVIGVLLYEMATPSPFILNCVVMGGLMIFAWKNASLWRPELSRTATSIVS
jgi:MFS family permease